MKGFYSYWCSKHNGLLFHHLFEHPWNKKVCTHHEADLYSFIASEAHKFCFNYAYLQALVGERKGRGNDELPIPTPLQFIEILEFRLSEIKRAANGGHPEWQWPASWPGGSPSWNGHVLQHVYDYDCLPGLSKEDKVKIASNATQTGIRVHKEIMGHGQPILIDDSSETWRINSLIRIFLRTGFSLTDESIPRIYQSLDQTYTCCRQNTEENRGKGDIDEILGIYSPEKREIILYDRAISSCADDLNISRKDLRAIVIIHELAHFLSHVMACKYLPQGWPTSNFSEPDSHFHEACAQLAVYTMFGKTKDHYQESFEALLKNQSSVYHHYQKLLERTGETDTIWAALSIARSRATTPRLDEWLNQL